MGNQTNTRRFAAPRLVALIAAAATLAGSALAGAAVANAATAADAKSNVVSSETYTGTIKGLDDPAAQRAAATNIIKDETTAVYLKRIDVGTDTVTLGSKNTKDVDLSGWTIKDDKDADDHTYTIPDGTSIKAAGEAAFNLDQLAGIGLGKSDQVRIFGKDGKEILHFEWTGDDKNAVYEANTDADGMIKQGATEPDQPSGDKLDVAAWPGLADVTAIDGVDEFGAGQATGEHTDGNLSGLVYQPGADGQPGVLWAADNDLNPTLGETGPKGAGAINKFVYKDGKWQQDPADGWTFAKDGKTKGGKQLHFKDGKGGVDSEGITLINGDPSKGVFIGAERDNTDKDTPRPSILRYDVTAKTTDANGDGAQDLTAVNEWNLTDALSQFDVKLSNGDDANLGVEGVAFIPNETLLANGFQTNLDPKNVHAYDPAGTANDFGGLFFAALEKTNAIYAFALATVGGKDVAYPVAQIPLPATAANAGYSGPRDLIWDAQHNQLIAQGDNSIGTEEKPTKALIATYTFKDGALQLTKLTATPAEIGAQNTEGYAVTPDAEATKVVDGKTYKPVFWADDAVTNGHSLRQGWIEVASAEQPGTAKVTLFGITDFHGHIENGGYLATALNETRAKNPNTLFVGAGDLVGASAFESSIADDVPAMEQLKAMGLVVSATGNHEYDKGAADLANRIVPGVAPAKYVVANVTGDVLKGKVTPYVIEQSGGKKIAFIGGIFKTLADSVSPAGMKGITVTDPIEAINKYADELSDGDQSNGEADAVVALVHADANDLKKLDGNVDAVLAGHTHLYETAKTAAGAPIIETANYGVQFSTTDLTIDGTGKDAKVSAVATKHDVFATDADGKETPLYKADPTVNAIYEDAKKEADKKGNEQLGTIAKGSTFNRGADKPGDLSTRGGNRGVESTLGILNGNAAKWAAEQSGFKADIGVINPGGMRADLDPDNDGKITLKEAHDVLPFGNSNAVVTLTGAQLKTLIEQQWQPADAQRPVLWLGFSDNVDYQYDVYTVTIDGKQVPRGSVHDLTVNGKAVKDTDKYLVAGNSFLLAGGDNFTVFQQGAGYVDTGYIDFDGFSAYLKAHPNLESAKARHSAGFSSAKLSADGTVTFTVSGLAFTTDETRPWGIRLKANGVDFGALTGLDFTGEPQGPGAGSITVTRKLTAAEQATFRTAAAKAPKAAVDAAGADGLAIAESSVETLFSKPSEQKPGSQQPAEQQPAEQQPTPTTPQNKKPGNGDKLSNTGSSVAWMAIAAALLLSAAAASRVAASRRR